MYEGLVYGGLVYRGLVYGGLLIMPGDPPLLQEFLT